ncbi:hypothetical protein [Paraburkholderia sp. JHI869]|uniref:hypothetical protein n=1 Tax=Paraburkholderia sp. JHI869 TaxID=3112959 RepID=UPI00316D76D1
MNRQNAHEKDNYPEIYLYTIANLPLDGWVKNDNAHNKLLAEWKIRETIAAGIISQEQIDIRACLAPRRLQFEFDVEEKGRPSYLAW